MSKMKNFMGKPPGYEDVDSNVDVKEDSLNDEEFDKNSAGDEEPVIPSTVQRTKSSRVSRLPNSLISTMTGKSHGNSQDDEDNSPLVRKVPPG